DFFYLGGLVSLGFAVVLFRFFQGRLWRTQPPLVWVLLWFAILITGISLPGKYFAHYGYQLFPPFVLFAAAMFTRFVLPGDVFRARVVRGAAIFLVITLPVTNYLKQKHHFDEPDHAKMIADYLNAKQEEGLTIYLDGYKHIIYYLTESPVLTRYVHPSLMYKTDHIKAIGLDVIGETTKIMQQRPRYILYREAPTNYLIQHFLENDYELEQSFPDDVHLFRIKDHGKQS
ncbi:MAG: hypothetical protein AAGB22_03695, partial [Bacteroidota bacterium]